MDSKRKQTIITFLRGLTRLYGTVDWAQFLLVSNKYIKPKVTYEEIAAEEDLFDKKQGFAVCDDFIMSTLAPDGVVDNAYNHAERLNKPYYPPTLAEIKELADYTEYFCKTPEHKNVYEYFIAEIKDETKAKKAMVEYCLLTASEQLQKAMKLLAKYKIEIGCIEDVNRFMTLHQHAANNTPLWANRGYTPNYLASHMPRHKTNNDTGDYFETGRAMKESSQCHLSRKEAAQFYNIWYSLCYFMNCKHNIVPQFKKPVFGERIDERSFIKIYEKLWENPKWIEETIQNHVANFTDEELQTLKAWRKKFIKSQFIIIKHLKSYSVFMDVKARKLYAVVGINNPIEASLRCELPCIVTAVLLPFNGKITYSTFIAVSNVTFGKGMHASFNEEYRTIKTNKGILDQL